MDEHRRRTESVYRSIYSYFKIIKFSQLLRGSDSGDICPSTPLATHFCMNLVTRILQPISNCLNITLLILTLYILLCDGYQLFQNTDFSHFEFTTVTDGQYVTDVLETKVILQLFVCCLGHCMQISLFTVWLEIVMVCAMTLVSFLPWRFVCPPPHLRAP